MMNKKEDNKMTIENLCHALKDSDWEVRFDAVKALRKLKDPRSVTPLTLVLNDPDEDIRKEAAIVLKEITGQEYVSASQISFAQEDRMETEYRLPETDEEGLPMRNIIMFRESTKINFPHLCLGCCKESPDKNLNLTIFSSPALSATGKAVKGVSILFGLATGGLGGAAGGAHLGNKLKKPQPCTSHELPICNNCLAKLSSADQNKLVAPSDSLFTIDGISNIFMTLNMFKECAILYLSNSTYVNALLKLNPDIVFQSPDVLSIEPPNNLEAIRRAERDRP